MNSFKWPTLYLNVDTILILLEMMENQTCFPNPPAILVLSQELLTEWLLLQSGA